MRYVSQQLLWEKPAPEMVFVPLKWRIVLPALLGFTLIVSPLLMQSTWAVLCMVMLAGLSAVQARVHALGMGLLGVPALLAWSLGTGSMTDKSWLALLVLFAFYAVLQLFWGLSEEIARPWWAVGLLWLLMPSALGLGGLLLIVLLSHARWQSGLAVAQISKHHARGRDWAWVVLVLLVLMALSFVLPTPSGFSDPEIPTIGFSSQTPEPSPNNQTSNPTTTGSSTKTALPNLPNNVLDGLGVVAVLMLAYVVYLQRVLKANAPTSATRPKNKGGWLWLALLVLTGIVVLMILLGVSNPSKPVLVNSSHFGYLGLLFFLAMFVAWRLSLQRRAKRMGGNKDAATQGDLRQLRFLSPKDAVRAAYYQWLVWLRDLEIRRSLSQTPLELMVLVNTHQPHLKTQTQVLTESYQRVRYGTVPSQDELEQVLAALEEWQQEVRAILPPDVSPVMVGDTTPVMVG